MRLDHVALIAGVLGGTQGAWAADAAIAKAVRQDLCGAHLVAIVSIEPDATGIDGGPQDSTIEEVFRQASVAEDADADRVPLGLQAGDHLTLVYSGTQTRGQVGERYIVFLRKVPKVQEFALLSETALLHLTGGRVKDLAGGTVASERVAIAYLRRIAPSDPCAGMR